MTASLSPPPVRPGRPEQMSTRLAFFIAGFGIAAWAPLVPYAKARAGLDEGTLGLLLLADVTQAHTLVGTSNMLLNATRRSLDFTSDTTTSLRDMKVVLQARDDAASFVASAGDIRGAQLEAALQAIRTQLPQARSASDLQLAEAILAL